MYVKTLWFSVPFFAAAFVLLCGEKVSLPLLLPIIAGYQRTVLQCANSCRVFVKDSILFHYFIKRISSYTWNFGGESQLNCVLAASRTLDITALIRVCPF